MTVTVRQGLPRRPGGPAWPPRAPGGVAVGVEANGIEPDGIGAEGIGADGIGVGGTGVGGVAVRDEPVPVLGQARRRGLPRVAPSGADRAAAAPAVEPAALTAVPLRRGLPRVVGGEPWPPAGEVVVASAPARPPASALGAAGRAEPDLVMDRGAAAVVGVAGSVAEVADGSAPRGRGRSRPASAELTQRRAGVRRAAVWTGALVLAGAVAVLVARLLVQFAPVQDFLAAYPGSYPPPEGAPVGIPVWLSWQHFFNVFLISMILRTGLQVRRQARPEAYWAKRSEPRTRISLVAWTHQALDVLWVTNGVTYVVLLVATGQWMRTVPTSWTAFPNAVSTALQYLSLDWPVEDGWVYYNSLQQLSYTVTVFVAAPLAIATGVRMSIFWRGGPRWDRVYPIALARRIHVPVMLYFVAFIASHVAMAFATGARRNLDHMFAARDDVSWVGSVLFLVALAVIAGALVAVRPILVAPVASRFGAVSGR
ncbi:cytochrome b/b6 domain-containing protein [Actinotalea sp. M2MS4P-6]|uniref:cytochrome b/b6 domain-containing protein n=1 Tax=Actinotalea sp. M2MS4P-6 TaxID=2983762 RepID=UPI0021E45D4A|nr:cytochrome b/b6 domain-containing protein [Actinotalea sp. M2MS4P-6]MCV2396234.1 cytochrome b/b6 domain-containing protein [Actinotalea sp. M2MS4P-6]